MSMAAGRTTERGGTALKWDGLTGLILLGACFLAGTLAGFGFSCLGGESAPLREYLLRCLTAAGEGNGFDPSLLSVIWEVFRWPLLVSLLGFTALGAVGIPVVLAVRGFLLSYAVTAFARLFGLEGMAAALAAFGVTALVAVPALFVAAYSAFQSALSRLSHDGPPAVSWRARLSALGPCAGLLALAAALQRTVMPALLTAVCARLFAS